MVEGSRVILHCNLTPEILLEVENEHTVLARR